MIGRIAAFANEKLLRLALTTHTQAVDASYAIVASPL
jgi:hypothetical protein